MAKELIVVTTRSRAQRRRLNRKVKARKNALTRARNSGKPNSRGEDYHAHLRRDLVLGDYNHSMYEGDDDKSFAFYSEGSPLREELNEVLDDIRHCEKLLHGALERFDRARERVRVTSRGTDARYWANESMHEAETDIEDVRLYLGSLDDHAARLSLLLESE